MPHVNPQGVDTCVSAFIVNKRRCLLIDHQKLEVWLGVGGHWADTNKDETFDDALKHEIRDEVGIDWDDLWFLRQERQLSFPKVDPSVSHNHVQMLLPVAVDLHDFPPLPGHRHQALVYFAISRTGVIPPAAEYHGRARWFTRDELRDPALKTLPTIRYYADAAIVASLSVAVPDGWHKE